MAEDLIRYEALILDALRGVVRAVLQRVLKRGIPGEHHFFITFDTQAPGVGLSKRLKDQYPYEMTIVLQHQFWDLAVTEDRFEVRLSFNNIPERLVIPFSAVRAFHDPTVPFTLTLSRPEGEETGTATPEMSLLPAPKPETGGVSPLQENRAEEPSHRPSPPALASEREPKEHRTAEVVSLDKFRKK